MNGIVVIGESVVDRVVSAAGLTIARPGGSPANVAVGLGRLGDAVTLITELGDDPDGDVIRAHLADSNVTLIQQTVPSTSTAAAIISDDGNAVYEFEISWTLRRELVPPVTDLVHVGSLGAVMAPGALAVTEILDALPPHVVISYDPNIRDIIPIEAAAVEAIEAIVGRVHLVKASEDDLARIYPGRPVAETAANWLAAGVQLVVVTAAGAGSSGYSAKAQVHRAAIPVEVADTVGAGDAFMAALLHHLHAHHLHAHHLQAQDLGTSEIGPALEFAARAAAIACGRTGADPAWKADLL